MDKCHSFKFLDNDLNQQLVALLKKTKITYSIKTGGVIHYSSDDSVAVENDLICSIRDKVFSSWRVVTCPSEWIGRYRDYMSRRGITFQEELSNGKLWFLIPRKYRPHSWKLDDARKSVRLDPTAIEPNAAAIKVG